MVIENDGPVIVSSDFWESEHAARGLCYLSVNAGAFRLLIPPAQVAEIPDMLTGRYAAVTRGPYASLESALKDWRTAQQTPNGAGE